MDPTLNDNEPKLFIFSVRFRAIDKHSFGPKLFRSTKVIETGFIINVVRL